MPINFPDSPSVNDTHTVGDKTWTWDGTSWNVVTAASGDHGNLAGLSDDDHTQYLRVDGTRSADSLTISDYLTVDTDTLHVDSTNNRVGIGTTTPAYKLDAKGQVQIGADDNITPDALGNGHLMIDGAGYTGFASLDGTAMWVGHNSGSRNLYLATDETARVAVTGGGNVGIGTTSPGSMLDVRGGVQTHRILPFSDATYDLGANVLRWDDVYAANGTIQTSDERDKSNIADIDLGLAFVNDLRPVTYTWDDRSGNVGARTHMGFVAQQVATALGDEASNRAVWIHASAEQTTDPETGEVDEGRDIQGLRYNELMAPMVKAIQELSATVQTLTARIEALEST